ncbi:Crp/Fnr family transcriptional regulator [Lentzea pudingi]|uniref:Crp/Fnr family transcriptional regulator n=1 Tax=Lentzea pudingi TaxID=1789439 RepID=A0ABQ2HN47_9PSEU|nr:Crp/Fnr family transcriptional regulator [Lentzea pudingi]GGM85228.1 Crp/Fnr family transcriptional regulator [Lentzea pudingi]
MRDGGNFATRLSARELTELLGRGRAVEYQPGDHLMRQGEEGDCVIVVRSGVVKVMSNDHSGGTRLLAVRGPGELLGEIACVDDGVRSASVLAQGRVSGVKIARSRFLEYLDDHPKAAREVTRQVSLRLRAAENHAAAMTSECVDIRVLQALADMIVVFVEDSSRTQVEVPLRQCELAHLATASLVATHRSLRRLCDRNLVTTRYGRVQVPCAICLNRAICSKTITGCGGSPECVSG